ncbi:HNH endonuclease [Vibrio vulnificus]|nr:HNH endonuclease [Vibrio vulnificus]NVC74057.1 HNH endonuclease [Vibrio vulnificus]
MANRLILNVREINSIRSAVLISHKGWDNNKRLDSVKRKIKDLSMLKTYDNCCYCGRNIHGEFRMVLDIEHILPKSLCLKHMFTMKNLSVSCKRCNMNIKKNRIDFLNVDIVTASRSFKSKHYKFIHPNVDNYDAHLLLNCIQRGRAIIKKYSVVNESSKGYFNYNYFQLEALEKNSFDEGQGGRNRSEINNSKVRDMFERLTL